MGQKGSELQQRFRRLGMPLNDFAKECSLSTHTIYKVFEERPVRETSVMRVQNTLDRLEAEMRAAVAG